MNTLITNVDGVYHCALTGANAARANFTVSYNSNSKVYTVTNRKTGENWKLFDAEFIFGSATFSEVVDSFPNYVHQMVWDLQRYKNAMEEI